VTISTVTEAVTRVAIAGLVAASRRVGTESGEVRFLALEDESGVLECDLPAAAAAWYGRLMTTPGPYLLRGTPRWESRAVTLVVDELQPFHQRH